MIFMFSGESSGNSSVYEEKEVPFLETIGKQLCCDEKMVLTTVYCAYTSKPDLPSDIGKFLIIINWVV